MAKIKFWTGLALGTIGGVIIAQKSMKSSRMANAKVWQSILSESLGKVGAAVFMAQVQERYEELIKRRPIFENPILDFHVKGSMLPGLALYQILREDGLDESKAINEINRIFEIWFDQFPPLNIQVNQIMKYTPQNFVFFGKLVRFVTDKFFPEPGWQYDMVEENEKNLAFNMHSCFIIEVLNYYNAAELTPVFCKLDDYLMDAMPETINWGRTQTMGMGAKFCDFRWNFEPTAEG